MRTCISFLVILVACAPTGPEPGEPYGPCNSDIDMSCVAADTSSEGLFCNNDGENNICTPTCNIDCPEPPISMEGEKVECECLPTGAASIPCLEMDPSCPYAGMICVSGECKYPN